MPLKDEGERRDYQRRYRNENENKEYQSRYRAENKDHIGSMVANWLNDARKIEARNSGDEWTTKEITLVSEKNGDRWKYKGKDLCEMIGRSYNAIARMRHKLKIQRASGEVI